MSMKLLQKKSFLYGVSAFCFAFSTCASAAPLSLSTQPLVVAQSVDPNIMILFDTSGSMTEIVKQAPFVSSNNYSANCTDSSYQFPSGGFGDRDRYELVVDSSGLAKIEWENEDGFNDWEDRGTYEWGTSGGNSTYRCFRGDRNYSIVLIQENKYDDRYTYIGNYLNWYFANTGLTGSDNFGIGATRKPGVKTRNEVAIEAIQTLVGIETDPERLQKVRMGLAGFNGGSGALMYSKLADIDISANRTSLLSTIATMPASGSTPLAESLAELGRYFVDGHNETLSINKTFGGTAVATMSAHSLFDETPSRPSGMAAPVLNEVMQFSCQKNFIVAMTDGEPTSDDDYHDYLGEWDDGNKNNGGVDFDDIAAAMYDLDLRPTTYPADKNNIVTYPIGFAINLPLLQNAADNAGGKYYTADDADQLNAALRNIVTDVQGQISTVASVAFNSGQLVDGSSVFQAKFNTAGYIGQLLAYVLDSFGSIAATETWDAGEKLDAVSDYTTRNIFTMGLVSSVREGVPFAWDNLTTAQKNDLSYPNLGEAIYFNNGGAGIGSSEPVAGDVVTDGTASATVSSVVITNPPGSFATNDAEGYIVLSSVTNGPFTAGANLQVSSVDVATVTYDASVAGQNVLDFIAGDRSNEGISTGQLRVRNSRLGDIVNSTPVFVGTPELRWPDWGADSRFGASTATYSAFKNGAAASRTPVVYVGANDGMLHGFNGSVVDDSGTPISGGGDEVFAYIPGALYSSANVQSGLHYLASQDYEHKFYVDLTPTVSDVFIPNVSAGTPAWRTVLVGGFGAGGQGLFALDVTDPSLYSTSTNADEVVLWEFTSADDADMGYSFAQPSIALMPNGKWAAIVGNGYNSTNERSALFIIYLDGGLDGTWTLGTDYVKIYADSAGPNNGLSTPRVVDMDGDFVADRIYAGDLQGNMWAFDVSNTNSANWAVAHTNSGNPAPLFTGEISGSPSYRQPITSAPILALNTAASAGSPPNILVLFGTGKFLEPIDADANTDLMSYYGIWDQGTGNFTRTNLVERQMVTTSGLRTVTGNTIDWTGADRGWFIDLENKTSPTDLSPQMLGERVVADSLIRREVLLFNTMTPDDVACSAGGTGWLMSLNYLTGMAPSFGVFDTNNDGVIDSSDAGKVGQAFIYGLPSKSGVLGKKQYTPGSKGTIEVREINVGGGSKEGRLSWEEMYRN